MSNMTRSEFYQKYGSAKVTFSSYYKFTFTFTGNLDDGSKISVDTGGNSDEIYRDSVAANLECIVSQLEPYAGSVTKDGEEVDSFYDY